MAAPTIDSSVTSSVSSTGSLTMTMPATVAAGDTLIMIAGVRAQDMSTTVTGNVGGWTNIGHAQAVQTDMCVWYKKADGTEDGDTCVVGWGGASANASGIVYRITDAADPATYAPEAEMDFDDTDQSSHTPPAFSPSGGSGEYLWIVGFFHRTSGTVTAYPYVDNNESSGGGGGVSNLSGYCTTRSTTAAATLTPGAFTTSGAADSSMTTIAIYPVGGASGGPTSTPRSNPFTGALHGAFRGPL